MRSNKEQDLPGKMDGTVYVTMAGRMESVSDHAAWQSAHANTNQKPGNTWRTEA